MTERHTVLRIFPMHPTESACAFSPGHISGYFRRVEGTSHATTGSMGAGIVISEGVIARVERAHRSRVIVRQSYEEEQAPVCSEGSPPVEYALDCLGVTARVTTTCRLPIGAGFGMSAAALLATITAVDRVFDLGMNSHEIAACAHKAEVVHRTGLGDVAACQGGGVVIRKGPGIDAEIQRLYPPGISLFAVSFGPISTPGVLGSAKKMARVSSAFPVDQPASLEDLFRLSREFAEKSALITPDVRRLLEICDRHDVPASMTMLGNGVFAAGKEARSVLAPFGRVYEFTLARAGVRSLERCP